MYVDWKDNGRSIARRLGIMSYVIAQGRDEYNKLRKVANQRPSVQSYHDFLEGYTDGIKENQNASAPNCARPSDEYMAKFDELPEHLRNAFRYGTFKEEK